MATVLEQAERIARRATRDWPTLDSVAEVVGEARNAAAGVRHATTEAAERIELTARRRPLAAVGVAAAAGFLTGGVVAFVAGWFAGRRVRR
jgi:ElaB/YqjD/DUF883 family membrane-anchored ribosome-binding protein